MWVRKCNVEAATELSVETTSLIWTAITRMDLQQHASLYISVSCLHICIGMRKKITCIQHTSNLVQGVSLICVILLLSLQKFRNSAHTMPRGITWVIHAQLPIKTLKWLAIQQIPAGESLYVHPWRSRYIFCIDPYRNAIRQAPYWCNDACWKKSVRRMTIQANEVHLWAELKIVIYCSTLHFRTRILFRNFLT